MLLLRNNEGFDLEHRPEISCVTCLQTTLTTSFFNSGTFITADAMDLEFPNANCLPTRTYLSARFAVLYLVLGNLTVIYIMKTSKKALDDSFNILLQGARHFRFRIPSVFVGL